MARTDSSDPQTRIVGYTRRMGADAKVEAWKPMSEDAVGKIPPPAPRPPRGWKVSPPAEAPAAPEQVVPAPASPPPPVEQEAPPKPPSRGARPGHIQDGTLEAEIWEHPDNAAMLVRTMLTEDGGAAESGDVESGAGESGPTSQLQLQQIPLVEQVATVMVALGEELTGEVFKFLSDYEIEETSQAISRLKPVPSDIKQLILDEFRQHLHAREWVVVGGVDFARAALERACGPRKAQEILHRISTRTSSGFYMLKNVAPDQIAPFLSHEHPQTVALILSQLDPTQAAGIMNHLPQRMQADVAYRIATMENITPNVIKQIEESLESSLRDILGGNQDVGGPKVVADILNMTGSSVERNVLEQMDAQDVEVSEAVRNLMFVFSDIGKLTDREIQTLVSECDQKDLAVALKGADESTRSRFLDNMSEDVREFLTGEIKELSPMRLTEVEEVQLRVVQQVRQLEEQGKLTIVRGDSDSEWI
jgi:flagellar motor switch protein FliG